MVNLKSKTRDKKSPQGKQRVYFCCHPDDLALYLDPICEDIFQYADCAIWYKEDPDAKWDPEEMELELGQMQLFVIPVTHKFLEQENDARCLEFPYAFDQHIRILPLIQEEGLEEEFDKLCKSLHCLDKAANDKDTTEISFHKKLKDFLSSALLGDELQKKVWEAFDAYIFMSYRKKDRAYAQELMKLIYRNDFCRDIAIWYDEFLIPGEDFNEEIKEAMDQSSLVTFAVTPNLLESGNYVMDEEYPETQKSGKPILPAEMVNTDKDILKKDYPGMPDPVDAKDHTQLSDALLEEIKSLNLPENDQDPEHLYLIGLAYLNGMYVERNCDRAIQLLDMSAKQGNVKAQLKLADCYLNGDGVLRDGEKVMEYYTEAAKQGDAYAQYKLGTYYNDPDREWWEEEMVLCTDQDVMGDIIPCDYNVYDCGKAVQCYTAAAKQGLADAQYKLGRCYENGDGVNQDYIEAVKWYQKAAEQDNVAAMQRLGIIYSEGTIFAASDGSAHPDYEQAFFWYKKAAEHDSSNAMVALGEMYEDGQGVEQNSEQAFKLYKEAAECENRSALDHLCRLCEAGYGKDQDLTKIVEPYKEKAKSGDAGAQVQLGCFYESGMGVPQSYEQAIDLFIGVIESENYFEIPDAYNELGDCYYYGHGVARNYETAVEMYTQAAKGNNEDAIKKLIDCYENGPEELRDSAQARHWHSMLTELKIDGPAADIRTLEEEEEYRKHEMDDYIEWQQQCEEKAAQGDVQAQYQLGCLYEAGDIAVPRDNEQAVYWYTKAADQGYVPAQVNLGRLYRYGAEDFDDFPRDNDKAVNWYQKAADNGDVAAQYELGLCYMLGEGEACNFEQAFSWFKKAADQGYADAQSLLGSCYENGRGVEQNYEQAAFWYTKAAEQGDEDASKALNEMVKKGLI